MANKEVTMSALKKRKTVKEPPEVLTPHILPKWAATTSLPTAVCLFHQ